MTTNTTFDNTISNIGGTRGVGLRAFCANYDKSPAERVAAMLATGVFTGESQAVAFHDWYISHAGEMAKKLSADTIAKLAAATPHGKGVRTARAPKEDPRVAALEAQLAALQAAIRDGALTPAGVKK